MRHGTLTTAVIVYLVAAFAAAGMAQGRGGVAVRSVWDGVFTDAQAERGRLQFNANCAECHGEDLHGGGGNEPGPALAGDYFWMSWREQTVADLLDHIRMNMPFSDDGSRAGTLPLTTYQDIVAHILRTNGFPAGSTEVSVESAVGVRIMAKDGPGELPASTLARVVGCLVGGTPSGWRVTQGTPPARVTSSTPPPEGDIALGTREYRLMFVLTPLDKLAGSRVAVTGLLIGDGGADGLNVSTVTPVEGGCE